MTTRTFSTFAGILFRVRNLSAMAWRNSGMPDEETLDEITKRATIYSTETDSEPGKWVDVMV